MDLPQSHEEPTGTFVASQCPMSPNVILKAWLIKPSCQAILQYISVILSRCHVTWKRIYWTTYHVSFHFASALSRVTAMSSAECKRPSSCSRYGQRARVHNVVDRDHVSSLPQSWRYCVWLRTALHSSTFSWMAQPV